MHEKTKKWIKLFNSKSCEIRVRAAVALLRRDDTPLETLIDILELPASRGLCFKAEKKLIEKGDRTLFTPMIERLDSPHSSIRQVACSILGSLKNHRATPCLLGMLDDENLGVRCSAGYALGNIGDMGLRGRTITRLCISNIILYFQPVIKR